MASGSEGAPRPFIPRKWRMEAGAIDVSTAARSENILLANEFRQNSLYSPTNPSQLTFTFDSPGSYFFPSEAYIQLGLQITSSAAVTANTAVGIQAVTLNNTYPNGTPIAFKSGIFSTFFDKFNLSIGGQTVQAPPSLHTLSTFLMKILNISYDYLVSSSYQLNAFLLDQPGASQLTDGNAVAATISQSTSYGGLPGNSYNIPSRTHRIGFYRLSTAGTASSLDGDRQVVAATTGALSSAKTSASSDYYPVVLQSQYADNTNFWLRQSLTNQTTGAAAGTGNIWNSRIYLNEIIPYYQSYRNFEKGNTWVLQLYPNSVNNIIQRADNWPNQFITTAALPAGDKIPDGQVYISNMWLVMPSETPSRLLMSELDRTLIDGAIFQNIWTDVYSTRVSSMPAGSSSFTQQFNMPLGLLDFLVFQFVPTTYINNQAANQQISTVPITTITTYLSNNKCILTNSNINYQGQTYPNPGYGSFQNDNVRIYESFLELAGRVNQSFFGSPVSYTQYFTNYFYLTFDLRGRTIDASSGQTSIQPNINFSDPVALDTTVYAIGIKKQKSQYTVSRSSDLTSAKLNFSRLL